MNKRAFDVVVPIDDIDIIGKFFDNDGYPKGAVEFIKAALDRIKAELAEKVIKEEEPQRCEDSTEFSFIITNENEVDDDECRVFYRYEVTKNEGEVFFDIKKGNLIISVSERTAPLSDYRTHFLIFSGSLDKFEEFVKQRRMLDRMLS